MMNNPSLSSQVADILADEIICECCTEHASEALKHSLIKLLKDALEAGQEPERLEKFETLFKAIDPIEKKFAETMVSLMEGERKILIRNLRRLKKDWLTKDKVDEIMYPINIQVDKVADETRLIYKDGIEKEGKRTAAEFEFDAGFDVDNPKIKKWLKSYPLKFAKKYEGLNVERLRKVLIEGINAGEGIPELTKRVNVIYERWKKYRSMVIARTEAIRASNKGAVEAYIQSGVVKEKRWLTHYDKRTCDWCSDMDGKIVGVESVFLPSGKPGDQFVINIGDRRAALKLDYETVQAPPLHPLCRCTIIPIVRKI